jgi:hypothetical protein
MKPSSGRRRRTPLRTGAEQHASSQPFPAVRVRDFRLIDKAFDSMSAAGPVAWMAVVAIVALCAMAFVVYLMAPAAAAMTR